MTEPHLETISDLSTLRSKRGHRKGWITKGEKFLQQSQTISLEEVELREIERYICTLTSQRAGYIQIQTYLVQLMRGREDVEETSTSGEANDLEENEIRFDQLLDRLEDLKCSVSNIQALHKLSRITNKILVDLEDETDLARTDSQQKFDLIDEQIKSMQELEASVPECACDRSSAVISRLKKRLREIRVREAAETPSPARVMSAPIATPSTHMPHRLPRIEIPTFTGDHMDWTSFWTRFSHCLAQEPRLTAADKVAYLQASIKCDRGIEVLKASPGMEDDYDGLVDILHKTFDKKRLVFRTHLKRFSQYRMKAGSKSDVSSLTIHLKQGLHSIRSSGQSNADYIYTAMAELMMDETTFTAWSLFSREHQKVPSIELLLDFTAERYEALPDTEVVPTRRQVHSSPNHHDVRPFAPAHSRGPPPRNPVLTTQRDEDCGICHNGRHSLSSCPTFRTLTQAERFNLVQKHRVCSNCLSSYHAFKNCQSKGSCRECGGRHHTLLHRASHNSAPVVKTENIPATTPAASLPTVNIVHQEQTEALFLTGRGVVETPARSVNARIFFDSGAGATLITSKLASTLRARTLPGTVALSGVTGIEIPTPCRRTVVQLYTGEADEALTLTAIIVDKITTDQPVHPISIDRNDPVFEGIELSDPAFDRPGTVDLLVGLRVFNWIALDGIRRTLDRSITIFPTTLGWLVSCITPAVQTAACIHVTSSTILDEQDHNLISSFWEIEHGPSEASLLAKEDQQAVEHFAATTTRDGEGRYQVQLPRRADSAPLGRSREQAVRRYISNEKSLQKQGRWSAFSEVITEYDQLHHSEKVPQADLSKQPEHSYYLPMHGVCKDSSTTTKLRVVFDASAKTSTGTSLNDTLLPGPSLYPMLNEIILRFRNNKIGLTADIAKMFREISLHPQDRDFHRFLWRDSSGILRDWRMTRLTFGVTSSPFLATQVLRHLATDHQEQFPRAAAAVYNEFYVDDCLTGAATEAEAVSLQCELNALMEKGAMTLRKWRSSSSAVLTSIPTSLREDEQSAQAIATPSQCHKALGVHWSTETDTLHVATPELNNRLRTTKRQITSELAKTFDIMGWFAPAILVPKALVQSLWKLGIGWDEVVPDEVEEVWRQWRQQLPTLTSFPVPRYYYHPHKQIQSIQLHGFSDASKTAYAGVIYLRAFYTDTTVSTIIVTAKSRLAPLKELTIPRLELCGAQLLSRVMQATRTILQIPLTNCFAWCDSTIVLAWLHHNTGRLQTFVANRVIETTSLIPASQWKHVPTADNPADAASRGLLPKDLLEHNLWWKGPPWLSRPPSEWPARLDHLKKSNLPELKKITPIVVHLLHETDPTIMQQLTNRISSWNRIRRVMAWVLRIAEQFRKKKPINQLTVHPLEVPEIEAAELQILRMEQSQSFPTEISSLKHNGSVFLKSCLSTRHPFLDDQGVLRVGGRIQRSQQTFTTCHPAILHKHDTMVKPLIRWLHLKTNHLGAGGLLGLLSESYFIIGARQVVRAVTRNCVTCRRVHAKTSSQLMGQLPPHRINPSSVFAEVGVDFAGPLTLKKGHTRRPVFIKGYIALFICMATKAVHLEPVTDLTTEAFLAALHRFVSRRGKPRTIHSDNGTNFLGAEGELRAVYDLISKDENATMIHNTLSAINIEWDHIPGRAPHFGGLWESSVKSVKSHLRKTVGTQRLNIEELFTVLAQIEAALNSRPLVPMDQIPADGSLALTPGHFLIGRAPLAIHTRQDVQNMSLLRRWNLCQHLAKEFWQLWSRDYVVTLNRFSKWKRPERNLQVGDVVLLKDQALFANNWPLGRIVQVHPGKDNLVRAVTVKVNGKEYRRPTVKTVLLLPEDETDSTSCRGPEDGYAQAPPTVTS